MNPKQKLLTGIALALFCVSLFRSPWDVTMLGTVEGRNTIFSERHYAPLFRPPLPANIAGAEFHARLLWPEVLLPWIALGVIYAGAFLLLKPKRQEMNNSKKGETPQEHEARMKKWKQENEVAIASGKMTTLHAMPEMTPQPLAYTKQILILHKFKKLFSVPVKFVRKWRN